MPAFEVAHARRLGWHELQNGRLIAAAEDSGYDVLLTTDKNMQNQHSIVGRRVAVVTVMSVRTRLADLVDLIDMITQAVESAQPGTFVDAP